jgi:hypothetical protein
MDSGKGNEMIKLPHEQMRAAKAAQKLNRRRLAALAEKVVELRERLRKAEVAYVGAVKGEYRD